MSYYELPKNEKEEKKMFLHYIKDVEELKEMRRLDIQALRTLKLITRKKKDGKPFQRPERAFSRSGVSLNDRYFMDVTARQYKSCTIVTICLKSKVDPSDICYTNLSLRKDESGSIADILESAEKQAEIYEKQLAELESVNMNVIRKYVRQLAELKVTIDSIGDDDSGARSIFKCILM